MMKTRTRSMGLVLATVLVLALSSCGKDEGGAGGGGTAENEVATLVAPNVVSQMIVQNGWCTTRTSNQVTTKEFALFKPSGEFSVSSESCFTGGQPGTVTPGCSISTGKDGSWKMAADGYLEFKLDQVGTWLRYKVYELTRASSSVRKVRLVNDNGLSFDYTACTSLQ
jgi:hypothetical protein